jgi:hypothetical protein
VYIRGQYLAKNPFRLAAETNMPAACAAWNGEKFWIFVDENSE